MDFSWYKRVLLTFVLVLSFSFVFVQKVLADNFIGTHTGEGDIPSQIIILKEIRRITPISESPDFPVTVQINADTKPVDYQKLAQATKENNFFTIVRINNTCAFDISEQFVREVKAAFGEKSVIEIGNEVNNQAYECKDYAQYRDNLVNLKNVLADGTAAPSTIDYYNTIDRPENLLKIVGEDLYYQSSPYGFVNAYGCVGIAGDQCLPESGGANIDTYLKPINEFTSRNKPFYLTEFSLLDEAEKDLTKAITFIKNYGPKTGAQKITPLVKNVCNKQAQWLIYIDGDLYSYGNKKLNKIDPQTCSSSDKDVDPVFVEPIDALFNNNSSYQDIYAALKQSGYRAYCSGTYTIKPDVDIEETLQPLFNQEVSVDASVSKDSPISAPYLRAEEGLSAFDSLENYLSLQQTSGETSVTKSIEGGPIYRQMTGRQRCETQVNLLEMIESSCNLLEDPSKCALDGEIPNTNTYPTQLLSQIRSNNIGCENIEGKNENELSDLEIEVRNNLRQLELASIKYFRLAFIVIKIDKQPQNQSTARKFFNIITNQSNNNDKTDLIVIATKVPDVFSQKSDVTRSDSIQKSALTLTPYHQIVQNRERELAKRDVNYRDPNAPGGDYISCSSDSCQQPLSRGIETLIENTLSNPQDCQPNSVIPSEVTQNTALSTSGELDTIKDQNYKQGNLFDRLKSQSLVDTASGIIGDAANLVGNVFSKVTALVWGNKKETEIPTAPIVTIFSITPYDPTVSDVSLQQLHSFSFNQNISDDSERFPALSRLQDTFLKLSGSQSNFAPVLDPNCVPDSTNPSKCLIDGSAKIDTENQSEPGLPTGQGKFLLGRYLTSSFGSPMYNKIKSIEESGEGLIEKFLSSGDSQDNQSLDPVASDIPINPNLSLACMEAQGNRTITVYDKKKTAEIIVKIAKEQGVNPQLLYGIFKLESYAGKENSYREAMKRLNADQTSTISCAQTINSCGAMGPMGMVDGRCANTQCKNYSGVETLIKDYDICTLEGAVSTAAQKLRADSAWLSGNEYHTAGRYAGYINADKKGNPIIGIDKDGDEIYETPLGDKCEGLPSVSGCNGLNYCQCAVDGFDNELRTYGLL